MSDERTRNLKTLMANLRAAGYEIAWDQMDNEPIRQFAHVMDGRTGTNVHTTDSLAPDDAYGSDWTHTAAYDLNRGEKVA